MHTGIEMASFLWFRQSDPASSNAVVLQWCFGSMSLIPAKRRWLIINNKSKIKKSKLGGGQPEVTADYRYAKDTPAEDSQTFLKIRFNCYFWREIVIKQNKSNLDISRPKVMTKCRVFFSSLHAKKNIGHSKIKHGSPGEKFISQTVT